MYYVCLIHFVFCTLIQAAVIDSVLTFLLFIVFVLCSFKCYHILLQSLFYFFSWPIFFTSDLSFYLSAPPHLLSYTVTFTLCICGMLISALSMTSPSTLCIFPPLVTAPYWLRSCIAPGFICWFWRYINLWFDYLTYFLTYLLHYASASSTIGPFHFQAGGRRRRPNLALVFCVYYTLLYILDACLLFCVSCSFSVLSQEISCGSTSQNQSILCLMWRKTLTPSINPRWLVISSCRRSRLEQSSSVRHLTIFSLIVQFLLFLYSKGLFQNSWRNGEKNIEGELANVGVPWKRLLQQS